MYQAWFPVLTVFFLPGSCQAELLLLLAWVSALWMVLVRIVSRSVWLFFCIWLLQGWFLLIFHTCLVLVRLFLLCLVRLFSGWCKTHAWFKCEAVFRLLSGQTFSFWFFLCLSVSQPTSLLGYEQSLLSHKVYCMSGKKNKFSRMLNVGVLHRNLCTWLAHVVECQTAIVCAGGWWCNPLTPTSDQDRISPYIIHTISSRQVMRIEKNISHGLLADPISNSPN